MIFDFEDFESGAGLDYVADLAFAHLENDGFDLRREISFFEGAEIAAVFCGAALGIKSSDVAEILAVDDAGAQAFDFFAKEGIFFRLLPSVLSEISESTTRRALGFLLVRIVILLSSSGDMASSELTSRRTTSFWSRPLRIVVL